MTAHECRQERRLDDVEAAALRHTKEFYEGREGREPVIVRLRGLERIVYAQVYIASALLLAALIGAGTQLWRQNIKDARAASAHNYDASAVNN